MAMSKRRYEHVAKALCAITAVHERRIVAELLAIEFGKDNPRFDRNRFFTACNVPTHSIAKDLLGIGVA